MPEKRRRFDREFREELSGSCVRQGSRLLRSRATCGFTRAQLMIQPNCAA